MTVVLVVLIRTSYQLVRKKMDQSRSFRQQSPPSLEMQPLTTPSLPMGSTCRTSSTRPYGPAPSAPTTSLSWWPPTMSPRRTSPERPLPRPLRPAPRAPPMRRPPSPLQTLVPTAPPPSSLRTVQRRDLDIRP